MASVEAKLAESLTQTANLREALEKEVEERRRDHDKVVAQEEQIKTLFRRVEEVERRNREQDEERGRLLKEIEEKQLKREEAADKKRSDEKKDAKDEKATRISIWIPVITAIVGAALGAFLTVWLALKLGGKVP